MKRRDNAVSKDETIGKKTKYNQMKSLMLGHGKGKKGRHDS
jgi:hypothetical protein